MKSFVRHKTVCEFVLTSWILSLALVAVFSSTSLSFLVVEAKKSQYAELLTNENELFLIENAPPVVKPKSMVPAAAAAVKPHPVVRRSADAVTTNKPKNVTSHNNNSKSTTKKTTTKKSPPSNNKTKTMSTATKSSEAPAVDKLIVKIVYTSSNSDDQARTDLTRLVYSTSESLSSCDKAPCKSSEVCVCSIFVNKLNIAYIICLKFKKL